MVTFTTPVAPSNICQLGRQRYCFFPNYTKTSPFLLLFSSQEDEKFIRNISLFPTGFEKQYKWLIISIVGC